VKPPLKVHRRAGVDTYLSFQAGGSAGRTTHDGALVPIAAITRFRPCGRAGAESVRVAVLGRFKGIRLMGG
jgi:hypothetical protein